MHLTPNPPPPPHPSTHLPQLSDDPKAIHIVFFLLCFYSFKVAHGDLHFEFAIEHLLVMTFDPLILRSVRGPPLTLNPPPQHPATAGPAPSPLIQNIDDHHPNNGHPAHHLPCPPRTLRHLGSSASTFTSSATCTARSSVATSTMHGSRSSASSRKPTRGRRSTLSRRLTRPRLKQPRRPRYYPSSRPATPVHRTISAAPAPSHRTWISTDK